MAKANQIKALIKAHFSQETELFRKVALDIADYETKQNHLLLAHDIRSLLNISDKKTKPFMQPLPKELKGLISLDNTELPKHSFVVNDKIQERIDQIIEEYQKRVKLKSYGLSHRRKILLIGPPGTGKTITAKVLAHETKLPLNTIQSDYLITKFMGETGTQLRLIFDYIKKNLGIYFFDEFDSIGGDRSMDNDVGEMRRVLNSFLQFIEQDTSDSIIISATNNPQLLDKALFRRFDDVLYYEKPTDKEKQQLIIDKLGTFNSHEYDWRIILEKSLGLSHAEIILSCEDAMKKAILANKEKATTSDLCQTISNRQKYLCQD